MNNRRSYIYVNGTNHTVNDISLTGSHDNLIANRGLIVLTDYSHVSGDRYLRSIDLKASQWIPRGEDDPPFADRYTLQIAVVPDGTKFTTIELNNVNFTTYPLTQDTIYTTTMVDAIYNGIKVDNINKSVPRGYYVVCFLWENYNSDEHVLTPLNPNVIVLSGRIGISF